MKRKYWKKIRQSDFSISILAALLFLTLATPIAWASANQPGLHTAESPEITINTAHASFDLSPYIETIEDNNNTYTMADIRSGKYDHLWQRNTKPIFIAPRKTTYWFRVQFNFSNTSDNNVYLLVDYLADLFTAINATMVQTNQQGQIISEQIIHSGRSVPFNDRNMIGQFVGLKIYDTHATSISVIGKFNNADTGVPALLPLVIYSEEAYQEKQQTRLMILAGFFSAMGAMFLYSVSLLFVLRERVYCVYILFLLTAIMTCSVMHGLTGRWLFPASPVLDVDVANANGIFSGVLWIYFVYISLDAKTNWPKLMTRFYEIIMILGLLFTPLPFLILTPFQSSMLAQSYDSLALPLALIAIIVSIIRKDPIAPYLFVAEMSVIIGSIFFLLMMQGVVSMHAVFFWGMHWGFFGEVVLFSLALAAKTKHAIIMEMQTKMEKDKFEYMALHDSMTDLPNRKMFMDALNPSMARARRHNKQMGLMMIDLNGFKAINDTYGHDAGDAILCHVAKQLANNVRENDIPARLGGDEFAIILEDISIEDIPCLSKKILAAIAVPIQYQGTNLQLTGSIGVSLYPSQSNTAADLIKLADDHMYKAKTEKLGCYWQGSELAV
jgi:diguanylate cyclase (GGDEF)-like protein